MKSCFWYLIFILLFLSFRVFVIFLKLICLFIFMWRLFYWKWFCLDIWNLVLFFISVVLVVDIKLVYVFFFIKSFNIFVICFEIN